MKPKNVLHIISKFNGDYPLFDDFLLRLDPSRFQSIVCFLRGKPEHKSRLEKEGVKTIYLDISTKKGRGVKLTKLLRLKGILQEEGIDLIHCQRHKPTVYGVWAAMMAGGLPVIASVHGAKRTRSRRRRLANRVLFSKAAKVIAVSNAVRKDILMTNGWLSEEKVIAVQNGLDYTALLKAQSLSKKELRHQTLRGYDQYFWFGTVGRLTPVKNHERLIRAFAGVTRRLPDTILLIAGSGPLDRELTELIKNNNLEERVHLMGYRQDVPQLLRTLDAFVFPSISEGLGLALLEAMASGLPIVASRIDASLEVMDGLDCGIYVNPLDEEDIVEGMVKMKELDPDVHVQMGEMARKRAIDCFSIDRVASEITSIYDAILSERNSSHEMDAHPLKNQGP